MLSIVSETLTSEVEIMSTGVSWRANTSNIRSRKPYAMNIRSDCTFPTLYQIRRQGRYTTPVAYATAHVAALFIKYLPRDLAGVFAPEMLPAETRRAILAGLRNHNIRITHKTTVLKHKSEDEEEF